MRVLLDTNILLDVALKRSGLHSGSETVLLLCARRDWELWVAWHTMATVYYIPASQDKAANALEFLKALMEKAGVQVAETGTHAMQKAFSYGMSDFEDAVQVAAAEADVIVTLNKGDFKRARLPVETPEEFVNRA